MLMVPQISTLKHIGTRHPAFAAHVYEALDAIRKGVNAGFIQLGIDPSPSPQTQAQANQPGNQRTLPAPSAPAALALSVLTAGIMQYTISPAADVNPAVVYYLQTATDANFTKNVTTINLGHAPSGVVAPGSGVTLFVRCWTQQKNSQPSAKVPGGPVTTL